MKKASWFLAAELAIAVAVGFLFKAGPDKRTAGLIAGALFVGVGVAALVAGAADRLFRQSWTFRIGLVHLSVTAAPMWISRWLAGDQDFQDATVLGVPGPLFHRLATAVYVALTIGSAVDVARSRSSARS